jgi:hypothetical protein
LKRSLVDILVIDRSVAPSPAGKWLGVKVDRAGRVRIQHDLTVPEHPEVFVIGDTASLDQDGKPLPGVAQVAMQQGKYAAKSISRKVTRQPALPPFRYFDKGNLAVIGKNFAVLQSGGMQVSGFLAWLVWALIHIQFLAENSLRFSVYLQWAWTYLSGKHGERLIIRPRISGCDPEPEECRTMAEIRSTVEPNTQMNPRAVIWLLTAMIPMEAACFWRWSAWHLADCFLDFGLGQRDVKVCFQE